MDTAVTTFKKKFKSKSGHAWVSEMTDYPVCVRVESVGTTTRWLCDKLGSASFGCGSRCFTISKHSET